MRVLYSLLWLLLIAAAGAIGCGALSRKQVTGDYYVDTVTDSEESALYRHTSKGAERIVDPPITAVGQNDRYIIVEQKGYGGFRYYIVPIVKPDTGYARDSAAGPFFSSDQGELIEAKGKYGLRDIKLVRVADMWW